MPEAADTAMVSIRITVNRPQTTAMLTQEVTLLINVSTLCVQQQ